MSTGTARPADTVNLDCVSVDNPTSVRDTTNQSAGPTERCTRVTASCTVLRV